MSSNKLNLDLISWSTFRKGITQRWYVQDGVKGWIRDSVLPTLSHFGWKIIAQEYDYGLFEQYKPKAMADRLIREFYNYNFNSEADMNDYEYLYYPYYYTGNNGYMDALYVFRRQKTTT